MKTTYLLGVDIGTSGTKTVLFDTSGAAIADATVEYPLYQPKRKALSILFQPVKTFGEQRARKPNTGIIGPHGVP